jgi:hypothetical protein
MSVVETDELVLDDRKEMDVLKNATGKHAAGKHVPTAPAYKYPVSINTDL